MGKYYGGVEVQNAEKSGDKRVDVEKLKQASNHRLNCDPPAVKTDKVAE